jgi:hypothetical protein
VKRGGHSPRRAAEPEVMMMMMIMMMMMVMMMMIVIYLVSHLYFIYSIDSKKFPEDD